MSKRLSIDNFRGFSQIDLDMTGQSAALIEGSIGSGKSTILTALGVLNLPESESIRLGMLFRSGVMPKVMLDEFAVRYAEHILQWWWQHNPEYVKKGTSMAMQ